MHGVSECGETLKAKRNGEMFGIANFSRFRNFVYVSLHFTVYDWVQFVFFSSTKYLTRAQEINCARKENKKKQHTENAYYEVDNDDKQQFRWKAMACALLVKAEEMKTQKKNGRVFKTQRNEENDEKKARYNAVPNYIHANGERKTGGAGAAKKMLRFSRVHMNLVSSSTETK